MNDYQRVCGVQARANLYELVLGMGIGDMVQEALLLFQRWSDFAREGFQMQ